jgi:hypothetical protein|tara:strand:+ start:1627 stop:2037 length:411 start_codon:yes stop_codon:yes gene_type:complete
MSWATSYSSSNNVYFDLPPMMEDGRVFDERKTESQIMHENMIKNNSIKTNADYRKYLANNADSIISYNQVESYHQTGFKPVIFQNELSSNVPYLFKSKSDPSRPVGYNDSDLKKKYLTREQLQSQLTAPVIELPGK